MFGRLWRLVCLYAVRLCHVFLLLRVCVCVWARGLGQALRDYVTVTLVERGEAPEGVDPSKHELSSTFPRRLFGSSPDDLGKTLAVSPPSRAVWKYTAWGHQFAKLTTCASQECDLAPQGVLRVDWP